MDILSQLGVALGLATLAGVNLYLTVLITGLAVRFDLLHLATQYENLGVLGDPVVLAVAGVLFVVEFFADKIPWVDSLWDSVHTVIRPAGGVMLGLQALGHVPPYMQVVAALVAGGAALTSHSAKAGTRLLINHSPEPFTNVAMSVSEDVAVVGGTALTLLSPVVALGVFSGVLVLFWLLFPRLWRGIRATLWLVWNKLRMPGRRQPLGQNVELPREVNDELRDLLLIKGALHDDEVRHAIRCLTGKSRGVRGLSANLDGVLVLTSRSDVIFFAAFKGLSARLFKLPLSGSAVEVESKFLSENLVLDAPAARLVFRLPRGQSDIVESVALRLQEMLATSQPPDLVEPSVPEATAVPDPEPTPFSTPLESVEESETSGAEIHENESVPPLPAIR